MKNFGINSNVWSRNLGYEVEGETETRCYGKEVSMECVVSNPDRQSKEMRGKTQNWRGKKH